MESDTNYIDLADEYQKIGNYDLAIENYHKAINKEPENAKIYNALAICYYCKKDYESAIMIYEEAVKIRPDYAMAFNNLGLIYSDIRKYDKSIENYLKAIEIYPEYATAYNNLGNIFCKMYKYAEAVDFFEKAIELKPDYADAYSNTGIALHSLEKYDEAIKFFEKAVELNPNNPETYNNLGNSYNEKRLFDLAIKNFLKAIELKPDFAAAYSNLSIVYLIKGDFEKGWEFYEHRFNQNLHIIYLPKFLKPKWDGKKNNGRLFVYMEQGLGDALMFARYFPVLKNMGLNLLAWVDDSLLEFFKFNFPYISFVSELKNLKEDDYDFYISSMSLPFVLKTTPETIPFSSGYLKAEPEKVKEYKEKYFNNDEFKIGINWQCKNIYPRDRFRTIPDISYLFSVAGMQGVKVYSIQKGEGEKQLTNLPDSIEIVNLGTGFNDFSETAAAIENLDVCITVDTSIAHLSGGLGKLTWITIPNAADWKWFLNTDKSIWYENAKLFRQKEHCNWKEVIDRICNDLQSLKKK